MGIVKECRRCSKDVRPHDMVECPLCDSCAMQLEGKLRVKSRKLLKWWLAIGLLVTVIGLLCAIIGERNNTIELLIESGCTFDYLQEGKGK